MAIYVGSTGDAPDKAIPITLGEQFGLTRLDHNRGADDDAVTSLTVQTDAAHRNYIPYSNRPITWHTDGYYNRPEHRIQGLLPHCVQPAEIGGGNALLDHEMAYILVRDLNPDSIRTRDASLLHDHSRQPGGRRGAPPRAKRAGLLDRAERPPSHALHPSRTQHRLAR
jgi:hypothetical protein